MSIRGVSRKFVLKVSGSGNKEVRIFFLMDAVFLFVIGNLINGVIKIFLVDGSQANLEVSDLSFPGAKLRFTPGIYCLQERCKWLPGGIVVAGCIFGPNDVAGKGHRLRNGAC